MPVKLSEIRAQFPMYDQVPDEQLLIGLHRKFYADLPFAKFAQAIEYDTQKADPTEGMSTTEKALASIGKSIVDTGRGLGQIVGLVDRNDVAESRNLDKALMNTTAGKVGNFIGDAVTTVPLAFVPGVNTVKGAALIGAATGLARPSVSTEETLANTGFGGAAGGGSILAGRALGALYQGATGLMRPLTKKGQEQIAAEILQQSATDPAKAAANAAKAGQFVKGSAPTLAQAADDPGLAQLERTLLNNPDTAGPLQRAYALQQQARRDAISGVAGTPEYREAIKSGRSVFAADDYAQAFAQGIDKDMAQALKPQLDSLLSRPSIREAQGVAKRLAAENDVAIKDFGSLEGMDWLKKALDNKISKAAMPGSSIGKEELRGLVQTKADLMDVLEQIAPGYKAANDNFAKMSRNINAMDVAADLQKRLYKNAEWGAGKEMGSTYMTELSKAIDSVKKQIGMNLPLNKVMDAGDIAVLEGIAKDLARKEAAQNLGRAVGSPTMQNMLGQNLINRITGPLGAPQSFGQNVLASWAARPYDFVMQSAKPKIGGYLGEALADPQKARQLLMLAQQQSKAGLLATRGEKFLPVGGLLALEANR